MNLLCQYDMAAFLSVINVHFIVSHQVKQFSSSLTMFYHWEMRSARMYRQQGQPDVRITF